MPRRLTDRVRRAAGNLGEPYVMVMMGSSMPPVHMVAGSMWIDPAARPRKVTVMIEHVEGEGDSIHAERMFAVKRKSGWRVYMDAPLGWRSIPNGPPPLTATRFLWTSGPLDPRDEGKMWCWGWKSEAAKALLAADALR